jgi:hypothetical protein
VWPYISNNVSLSARGSSQAVRVRHRADSSSQSSILSITEVVSRGNRISLVGRVQGFVDIRKDVVLHEQLCSIAGVDAVVDTLIVVVVDMAGSETERRGTRVQVLPVVVHVGHCQVAGIFVAVVVAVTDE